jgi:outer membrane protein
MRNAVLLSTLVGLFSTSANASASFANRSIGVDFSGFKFAGEAPSNYGLVPIALQGGIYIDSGFEVFLRAQLALFYQRTGVGSSNGAGFVWGGGGDLGARYLFLEENIRPYVEVHLAIIGIGLSDTATTPSVYVGPGLGVGVDVFVADSISIGPRGFFDFFLNLRAAPLFAFGAGFNVVTYF